MGTDWLDGGRWIDNFRPILWRLMTFDPLPSHSLHLILILLILLRYSIMMASTVQHRILMEVNIRGNVDENEVQLQGGVSCSLLPPPRHPCPNPP